MANQLIDPTIPVRGQTYTIAEAAKLLGISVRHTFRLIEYGDLVSLKFSSERRIPKKEIERIIDESLGFPARVPSDPRDRQFAPDGFSHDREG